MREAREEEGRPLPAPSCASAAGVVLVSILLACLAYLSLVKSEASPRPPQSPSPDAAMPTATPSPLSPTDAVMRDSTSIGQIQNLRGLPQAELERLIQESPPTQRVAALSILWSRGQQERARVLAKGDPLLEGQLRALEQRRADD